jgi:hypothetical protein
MEKKEWSEPELIVLVRSNPEEAVLTACKLELSGGPNSEARCYWGATACLDWGTS